MPHSAVNAHVRNTLPDDAANQIDITACIDKLDCRFIVLYEAATSTLDKLKRTPNQLAQVMTYSNITSNKKTLLEELHWLCSSWPAQ
jgi:hypothetical protein